MSLLGRPSWRVKINPIAFGTITPARLSTRISFRIALARDVTGRPAPQLENVDAFAIGINNKGEIVGLLLERPCNCNERGFLLSRAAFTVIEFPGAQATLAAGMNDKGQVVGTYVDATEKHHGFVYDRGEYFSVDVDIAGIEFTEAFGINNSGVIVGRYLKEDPNSPEDPFHDYGFIATPKR